VLAVRVQEVESNTRNHTHPDVHTLRVQVVEAKVTKTILTVFIGFVCCWIPVAIAVALELNDVFTSKDYELVVPFCCAMSSAVNPFIYGATDRRFRQTYKMVLKCNKFPATSVRTIPQH